MKNLIKLSGTDHHPDEYVNLANADFIEVLSDDVRVIWFWKGSHPVTKKEEVEIIDAWIKENIFVKEA